MNNELKFLHVLSHLSHTKFDIVYFKSDFRKIFYKIYQTYGDDLLKKEDIIGLSDQFFNTLFLAKDKNIRVVLDIINKHLQQNCSIDVFLSNLFYIVMNHYIKSFYKSEVGFKNIANTSAAIHMFIEYSKCIDFSSNLTSELCNVCDSSDIISHFEAMRNSGERIVMLNNYRGIPIQNLAKIIHTYEDKILVQTHDLQNSAANFEGSSYLLAKKQFGVNFSVTVKRRSIKGHDLLELRRFDKLDESFSPRQAIRIQLEDFPTVKITHNNINYNAKLYDLSYGGIAAVAARKIDAPQYTTLKVSLPDEYKISTSVSASLIHVSEFESGFKYHFQIKFNQRDENRIMDIISQKQKDIVKELRELL